jgi:hypothetical protein
MKKRTEVFLGGTCADGTNWREKLISQIDGDYFNPVVDDWNEEAYQIELKKRESCDYVLYVISPLMIGIYSIAEVVDDSNKRPEKTLFCVIDSDGDEERSEIAWSKEQAKSFTAVKKMVSKNGGFVFDKLHEVADFLNEHQYIEIK